MLAEKRIAPLNSSRADGSESLTMLGSFPALPWSCIKSRNLAGDARTLNLSDGTLSYSDYFSSPLNRFSEHYTKNRQQYASKTLHYFNAPVAVTLTDVNDICRKFNIPEAVRMLAFTDRLSNKPSGSGLIEWECLDDSLDALVICNHEEIPHPSGQYPFLLKLCFASPGRDARVLRPGDLVEVKWVDDQGYGMDKRENRDDRQNSNLMTGGDRYENRESMSMNESFGDY